MKNLEGTSWYNTHTSQVYPTLHRRSYTENQHQRLFHNALHGKWPTARPTSQDVSHPSSLVHFWAPDLLM